MTVKMAFAIDNVRYVCIFTFKMAAAVNARLVPNAKISVNICSIFLDDTCN